MRLILFLLTVCLVTGCHNSRTSNYSAEDEKRLELVREYADRILEQGIDRWSGENTPLLSDGQNVETGEPVIWRYDGEEYIISNMANQQNLFRILTGLSNLTGDSKYVDAAKASIRYHIEHLVDDSGLFRWGGHQFIDLQTLEPVGRFDADQHEFKNNFPYYELMWETDPEATARFIRAFWNAHIFDWEILDMNRHGRWDLEMGDLWDNPFGNPEPFFEGDGLTFINAGSDLMYAAGMLYGFNGEQEALEWSQRLYGMYVNARHPDTGLGVYQYSRPRQRNEPIIPMSDVRHTYSSYGDRAANQFGPQSEFAQLYGEDIFGDMPREGWRHWGGTIKSIYVQNGFLLLAMAELLGEAGSYFLEGTADGLLALAEQAYLPEKNHFIPMWADGTDLRPLAEQIDRIPYGYYCRRDDCDPKSVWIAQDADMEFLMTYARAYRLTGEELFWEMSRNIAKGLGLGEIGLRPGEGVLLNLNAPGSDYEEIFALLELYRSSEDKQFLDRARIVADRMIEAHFHNGFFLPSPNHLNADYNRLEPLAILSLDAVLRNDPELVPAHIGSRGYIHGRFDGMGRTTDNSAIWSVER